MKRVVPPIVVLGVVIGGWYLLAYSLDNNFASADGSALIIPPPHMLFDGMNRATVDRIMSGLAISLTTAIIGFLLSAMLGVLIGTVMSLSKPLESALWPWLIALQVTPIIVLTPIIVRILGASTQARVLVTVLIAFFPVASSTLFGMRSISQSLHDVFTLAGASYWRRLTRLQLPAASPAIVSGLRVSAGLAVIGSIVGDFFFTRGTPGLGRLIVVFFQDTRSGPMFVTSFVAILVGLGFFLAVTGINRLVISPWNRP